MKNYTLITGASRGIGLEFAKLAAKAGQNLILVARDSAAMEALKKEITALHPVEVLCFASDLAQAGAAQKLATEVAAAGASVDILINNAGYGLHGKFLDLDPADDLKMLHLNMITLTEMTRVFGRQMKEAGGGRILNVASTAAFQPGPLMSTYYATKAYVLSFSEALFEEFKEYGISVTTLCPGPTLTNFAKRANAEASSLFTLGLAMAVEPVAEMGFKALMKGERLVVPGIINCITANSARFLPRGVVLKISKLAAAKR
jgi:short-subunit dehydrogenase